MPMRAWCGLRLKRRLAGVSLQAATLWMPLLAMVGLQLPGVSLESLEVALWPEFDRPSVLVIYRFQLPAAADLPADVALPVPPNVPELHALAYVGPAGDLLNIEDYSIRPEESWSTVEFSSPGRQGQLEFYAELTRSGDERSFRFDWPGGVQLNSFGYEVQQPPTATDFSVLPAPTRQVAGQNGLTHYYRDLQAVGSASIELSYRKADSQLSAEALPAPQPPLALAQPVAPTDGGLDLRSALPWVVGGLGLVLLAAGLVWYVRMSRSAPVKAPAERRSRGRRRPGGAETEASPIYCHKCGTRAGPSDVYCRQCGTKLRGR